MGGGYVLTLMGRTGAAGRERERWEIGGGGGVCEGGTSSATRTGRGGEEHGEQPQGEFDQASFAVRTKEPAWAEGARATGGESAGGEEVMVGEADLTAGVQPDGASKGRNLPGRARAQKARGCGGAAGVGRVEGTGSNGGRARWGAGAGARRARSGGEGGVFSRITTASARRSARERLAEVAGGEEMVAEVGGEEQDDFDVAVRGAVLHAVVEQVKAGERCADCRFGEEAGVEAMVGDEDAEAGAGEEQRLIAEVGRGSRRGRRGRRWSMAAVAAGEDVSVPAEEARGDGG